MANEVFSTLYNMQSININIGSENIVIDKSEVVSISFMNNYDNATFPIVRFRIYADLIKIQTICEHPDELELSAVLQGGIYRMNDDSSTPTLVIPSDAINISGSGYIEAKNIISSTYDQYTDGTPKSTDLNDNIKSPLELFCYPKQTIHAMRARVHSIYRDMSIQTVIENIFKSCEIHNTQIDPIINPIRYDQVLIPNMTITESFSYIDQMYGLYSKGGMLYGDLNTIYLLNSSVNNGTQPIPIYVESYKNNSDTGGMKKVGNNYRMITMAANVNITTDTDVETTLHGPKLASVNLMDMDDVDIIDLTNLFENVKNSLDSFNLEVPTLLHKTKNKFIATSYVARLDEHITKVDLSGSGFDVTQFKPTSRFNLIFKSTLRGVNMNKSFRPTFVNHVLSPTETGLFIATTTMNLVTN